MRRLTVLLLLAAAAPAQAQIPQGPSNAPAFIGAPATPKPIAAPPAPRNPHMAPNGSSLLHEDAWQTDASGRAGPLGKDVQTASTFFARDCASVTFDSKGRIVTVCVGLDRPQLVMLDPRTLETLASMDLPPRDPSTGNPFTGFGGGGYFYLDDKDRAVIPTPSRHVFVVAEDGEGFKQTADIDLSAVVASGDSIISALPDWDGLLWFASRKGVVGTVDASGRIKSKQLEPIGNSFATGETGGVYIVTDAALYRLTAGPDGEPLVTWRRTYENSGVQKPGQTQAGSGTTPTLMARDLVAITDNADPMNIVVFTRDGREVCKQPVFSKGASATDQSLIAVGRALIVENNYGYSGPAAVENSQTTTPGLERVDVAPDLRSCRKVWHSDEVAPSVVPKVSLPNGLVYTYTKPASSDGDPWYLTALDFQTGQTVFKALAGEGLGFNNNYAPVSIGPDGTAYVGVLGGLVALRDATPPAQPAGPPRPRLKIVQRCRGHRVRARVGGPDTDWIRSSRVRLSKRRARASVTLTDGRVVRLSAKRKHC